MMIKKIFIKMIFNYIHIENNNKMIMSKKRHILVVLICMQVFYIMLSYSIFELKIFYFYLLYNKIKYKYFIFLR